MCSSESSCGCATASAGPVATGNSGVEAVYAVSGMTCGGCANRVTEQVSTVAGVTGVQIDVASGTVTVTSDSPVPAGDVQAAVERAGYQLVS
ncbi:heavy-metal-associated domain-containing protein [Spirilliplanes yamanashiensis]|uniref:HMA domain-containing protein n=1 Tax=Spirilliplanes yamanashiensis TaxID=42233 RepID=A0A8J3YEY1_9ACTN|nr:heavy metal-associated domain-containing protein [Spirilliplanes yamanashiensis]MDP9818448.1 copper chaperone CopZ [Spirilliplanes yamanashiensis]GIJ06428.1 hypothetical protein Sya03_57800 [Spirilliplanes yamanashiensis]